MHSLDPIPFAQLSDITPQYLLRSHLLQHGLELLPSWPNSLSLRLQHPFSKLCLFSIFSLFASQVWLNYVLRDVLWQTASPREVHFIHQWKWAAMWTAVKWLIFLSSSTTQPPPRIDTLRKTKLGFHGSRGKDYSVRRLQSDLPLLLESFNYWAYHLNLYIDVQMEKNAKCSPCWCLLHIYVKSYCNSNICNSS